MTSILRPVGPLDGAATQHLAHLMVAIGAVHGLVIVDLTAAMPISSEGWRLLEATTKALDAIGGALLITGATQQGEDGNSIVTYYPAGILPQADWHTTVHCCRTTPAGSRL